MSGDDEIAFSNLPRLPAFNVTGEPWTIGPRWKQWVARFEIFISAHGIKNEAQKRNQLLFQAGEEVQNLYVDLPEEQKGTSFQHLLNAFDELFKDEHNEQYERWIFNQIIQNSDEPIDAFYQRLVSGAKYCAFHADEHEKMIRDRIVFACRDNKVRRRLLRESGLSLKRTLEICRLMENTEKRAKVMESKSNDPTQTVDVADCFALGKSNARFRATQGPHRGRGGNVYQGTSRQSGAECQRCGRRHEGPGCVFAEGKTCYNCGKMNHLSRVCRGGKPPNQDRVKRPQRHANCIESEGNQDEQTSSSDTESVYHVRAVKMGNNCDSHKHSQSAVKVGNNCHSKKPVIMLQVGATQIPLLIDSGSTVNLLHESHLTQVASSASNLLPCDNLVFPYGSKTPLPVIGRVELEVRVPGKVQLTEFLILSGRPTQAILGKSDSERLGILKINFPRYVTDEICTLAERPLDNDLQQILKKYSGAFKGIGCLKDFKVQVRLKPGARPVVHAPSRIPIHLREAAKKELDEQMRLGVIEDADGATPWVARTVVVPKKVPGQVRITQDLRDLNKSVEREIRPILTLEEVLQTARGSKVFSSIDLNKCFHQFEISEESRKYPRK